jgi:hypothetical protein
VNVRASAICCGGNCFTPNTRPAAPGISEDMNINEVFNVRERVWATRDGCTDHYPRYCPPDCPNAGKHDAGLSEVGVCECHQCRLT